MMTVTLSSHESSCLANCRPLYVSACTLLPVFVQSIQEVILRFVPVASAMTVVHRDHLVLASNARWPDIQPLMSQIVSADLS